MSRTGGEGIPPRWQHALLGVLADAQATGSIGPGPLLRHLAQSSAYVELLEELGECPASVLDLGSGGGLPGLVVAARLPEVRCSLLDGATERSHRLAGYVERLGWSGRVEVVAERAEVAGRGSRRAAFDVVVARGFGPPAVTAECGAPFLRRGGLLVVSDPPDPAAAARRWPPAGCALVGLERLLTPRAAWSLSALRLVSACPERYPRRLGIPAKRPLF